eukprot:m.67711 g.67711  ORF g.67711 m.67711 type:complete len:401 (-) comp9876_c0_seq1:1383-2585(-)
MADQGAPSAKELAEAQRIADAINAGGGASDPATLAAIQGMIANGLADMAGISSGYLEELPPAVLRRVKALKKMQSEHAQIEAQYQKEILALDRKFGEMYSGLYAKRATITEGSYEPTEEECEWVESDDEEEEKIKEEDDEGAAAAAADADADVKGIPKFWLTVLQNFKHTEACIEDHDVPVLEYLQNITMVYSPEDSEKDFFELHFRFGENPFFKDETLIKRYFIKLDAEEGEVMYGGPAYEGNEGCKIEWLPGKDVTKQEIEKKQRKKKGKGAGEVRVVKRIVPQKSFFSFFDSLPPMPEEEPTSAKEEEAFSEIANMYYEDYQIADGIKGKLIPQAVLWFTGEALDYDEDDDEDDDDEGEEAELRAMLGGNLPDEDDEEHDPDYKPGAEEEKPECKQQ